MAEQVTIHHRSWRDDPERVTVFTIVHDNGETVDFTMPASQNGGIALAYLKNMRVMGEAAAAGWLIEEAIGAEAYDALAAEPDVDIDVIKAVAERIQATALGEFTGPAVPKA